MKLVALLRASLAREVEAVCELALRRLLSELDFLLLLDGQAEAQAGEPVDTGASRDLRRSVGCDPLPGAAAVPAAQRRGRRLLAHGTRPGDGGPAGGVREHAARQEHSAVLLLYRLSILSGVV